MMPMAATPAQVAAFSDREAAYYQQLFRLADVQATGAVSGQAAFGLLSSSGIDMHVLEQIWNIVDTSRSGVLDQHGFGVVLRLIAHAQAGCPVSQDIIALEPASLPRLAAAPPPVAGGGTSAMQRQHVRRGADLPTPTDRHCRKYARLFLRTDADADGRITAQEALQLFGRSGVQQQQLGLIWDLSDHDRDNHLNWPEFVVAMHLIRRARAQQALPEAPTGLPPELSNLFLSLQEPPSVVASRPSFAGSPKAGSPNAGSPMAAFQETAAFGGDSGSGWGDSGGFGAQGDLFGGDRKKKKKHRDKDDFGGTFGGDSQGFGASSPNGHAGSPSGHADGGLGAFGDAGFGSGPSRDRDRREHDSPHWDAALPSSPQHRRRDGSPDRDLELSPMSFGGHDVQDGGAGYSGRDARSPSFLDRYGEPDRGLMPHARPSPLSRLQELVSGEAPAAASSPFKGGPGDPQYEARLREIFGEPAHKAPEAYSGNALIGIGTATMWQVDGPAVAATSFSERRLMAASAAARAEAAKLLPPATVAPFLRTITPNFRGGVGTDLSGVRPRSDAAAVGSLDHLGNDHWDGLMKTPPPHGRGYQVPGYRAHSGHTWRSDRSLANALHFSPHSEARQPPPAACGAQAHLNPWSSPVHDRGFVDHAARHRRSHPDVGLGYQVKQMAR
eukprot:TRINITY_DN11044_c0_g3_i1.p1 TRINITY_DN11044_c0_g3~~TRINITY_DN11044_c0_g3_i1.p1  ORF type:complete len:670 (-),score=135.96 TRINITY_DN11044_c0_g3_i1:50-2059(-)